MSLLNIIVAIFILAGISACISHDDYLDREIKSNKAKYDACLNICSKGVASFAEYQGCVCK